jgi:hypothetical protein
MRRVRQADGRRQPAGALAQVGEPAREAEHQRQERYNQEIHAGAGGRNQHRLFTAQVPLPGLKRKLTRHEQ